MFSKILLDSMPQSVEMYIANTGWGETLKIERDVAVGAFNDKPTKYLRCGRTSFQVFLENHAGSMIAPDEVSITATVMNHQICSIDEACIQGGALRIGHFAVSMNEDFADVEKVDLRRRGIGRSVITGLARLVRPIFGVDFIDFDLSRNERAGRAEAYALFTDRLGAVEHGDLRRLPIDHLFAAQA